MIGHYFVFPKDRTEQLPKASDTSPPSFGNYHGNTDGSVCAYFTLLKILGFNAGLISSIMVAKPLSCYEHFFCKVFQTRNRVCYFERFHRIFLNIDGVPKTFKVDNYIPALN